MMVSPSKQTFLLLVIGLSLLCEVQSGVFVVYPFGVGGVVEAPKPKFSSRKLDTDTGEGNEGKSFNKTHLHLIYPVNEELIIMTPSPVEEIKERIFEFTERPKTDEFMATTSIPDATTEVDAFRSDFDSDTTDSYDLDTPTEGFGDTTPSDLLMTTTTEAVTNESDSLSVYDSTGPMKLLRKRMFEFKKYVPSSQIKLPTKNTNIPTTSTTTQRTVYRKRYFTTAAPSPSKPSKYVVDKTKMDKTSDVKKDRKKYTYKRWFVAPKKTDEEESVDSSSQPKVVEQETVGVDGQ